MDIPNQTLPEAKNPACSNRVDLVYAGILEGMSNGDYPEKSRMPTEAQLSAKFGVSRPTVREALSRLRVDGLITSRRGSGSYVLRRPDRNIKRFAPVECLADVQRCFAFRMVLESSAAELAAELRTEKDLANILEAIVALEESVELDSTLDIDLRFHFAVARASHNNYFVTALEMITAQIRTGMGLSRRVSREKTQARRGKVFAEHRAIYTAISEQKAVEAGEAVRTHLAHARRMLFEGIDSDE